MSITRSVFRRVANRSSRPPWYDTERCTLPANLSSPSDLVSCFVNVSLLKVAAPTAPDMSLEVVPAREIFLWNHTQWIRAVKYMVGVHVFVDAPLMPLKIGFQ